ncbi:MAG TPA: lipoyl synthase [Thermoanaerobaculia bacterium]|nr:lipoyl synthase [Thermoanaerobaculia bacterium]
MSETLIQIGQSASPALRGDRKGRPEWLRIKLSTSSSYHQVRNLVSRLDLHTVCQEARCPNIYECWGEHGTATFMILGDVCTRRCGFCAVTSGRPQPGVDADEPDHVAEAVAVMGLRHAVITSVDRDDLPDAGAGHFARVIAAIHRRSPGTAVEVLTPDFRGVPAALEVVLAAAPQVFSHNVETVPRLYRQARPGSRYERSLGLLARAAAVAAAGASAASGANHARPAKPAESVNPAESANPANGSWSGRIKTGIMVGLGEAPEEVRETLADIRGAGVEIVTIGQYLQPTAEHLPVARWVHPDEFAAFREHALALGFAHCEAGPLVRSSYHAHEHVKPPA